MGSYRSPSTTLTRGKCTPRHAGSTAELTGDRWRWIYIIEGAITAAAGVGSWFIIVDFPDSPANTFLTAEEKAFVKARLVADRGPEEHEKVTMKGVLQTAADWKPWAFSLMYMAGAVGVYAFLFFLPIILQGGLGFSLELSFVLSTPPALFSVVEALFISWLADRMKMRGPFIIFQGLVGIVGLCMTGFLNSPAPRYVGTFLGVAGANGLVVTAMAWQANNIVGDSRRAVSTAILISMSGVGGIYSSMVFRKTLCIFRLVIIGILTSEQVSKTHQITCPALLPLWLLMSLL